MQRAKAIAWVGLVYLLALVAVCIARQSREAAILLLAHLGLSLLAMLLYGSDKKAAKKHEYRTPEPTLHTVALLGGWPGAAAGQLIFRHKTKKEPFGSIFLSTPVLNLVGSVAVVLTQIGAFR